MKLETEILTNALGYCQNHCDSEEETAMVCWITEHIANAIQRNHPRFDYAEFMRLSKCWGVPHRPWTVKS